MIFPITEKVKMYLHPCQNGASGNYYYGLLEFNEMAFCLHYLRDKDTFFDVGANVGIYSLLAFGHNDCHTLAFEP